MNRLGPVWAVMAVLWRPIWRRALFEIPVFGAVAAMVLFFVSYPLKQPIDAIVSILGAPFEQIVRVAPGTEASGALSVLAVTGARVAPAREYDANRAYTPHLLDLEIQIVDDVGAYDRLAAGADLLSGAWPDGTRIDLDSARYLGVDLGDEVVWLAGDLAPVRMKIGGLLRPAPAQADGLGLLVVPAQLLPEEVLAAVDSPDPLPETEGKSTVVFDPSPRPDLPVVRRLDAIGRYVLEFVDPLRVVGLVGLLGFSFGLWAAVLVRSLGHVLGSLRARGAILAALGGQPTTIVLGVLIPELVVIGVGVAIGTEAARSLLFGSLLRQSLQAAVLLTVALPLSVTLVVVVVVSNRLVRRRLTGRDVVAELAAEEIE